MMTKHLMTDSASRLITLIMLLQRQPNQKASDLADKLSVSTRTLHRYITMLDRMGIPVYSERGPHGGFSLVRGFRMPPLIFSPEEAVAIYLGTSMLEQVWGVLYKEAAQGAIAKIENVLPDDQRQEVTWARKTLVATGMQRTEIANISPYLAKLRAAIREHRKVHMVYRSKGQAQRLPRDIDPFALVYRWGWWYIIAFCHKRQEVRSFRLDRIEELTLLEQTFTPTEFNIQEYLKEEFTSVPLVRARLLFDARFASIALDNRAYWDEMDAQPDGSMLVSLSAPDLTWAASTVLAYGAMVSVLEPPELMEAVRDMAQAVADRYK